TLDVDKILQRVVVEAAKALGCESAGIGLRENGYWTLRHVYGLPQTLVGVKFTDEESPQAVLAARTRRPLAINDACHDERVNREVTEKYKVRSLMIVPLIVREDVIGHISFIYHSDAVPFTEAQIDFANKLSPAVSLALENARLYAAQRNIADTLQEALLIVPQRILGIEFGHLYHSATEATKVGGDFYDLFELEHGKVGITLGDVSGKGLEAATLTSVVRNTIRAYAMEGYSPSEIMSKANDTVRMVSGQASFITVFFAVLDTDTGKLTYCSAGHPPAIVQRVSGVELLKEHSPIIGAFAGVSYTETRADLQKGDILVLYTDGVTEARIGNLANSQSRPPLKLPIPKQ
ncbi:MAG: SpoIIE family protein phosphatase, partial [Actinobacteria bacterium]|nr:SpoIIE family protein phosphatase [Actinomycetota bacterium]